MSIWNKVLVGLIGVAALAFFYMAARTLKTHQYWRELARQYEAKIVQVKDDNYQLVERVQKEGEQTEMGIKQVRRELHKLLIDRGRVWYNCDPKVKVGRDRGDAEVRITTDQPDPHGIGDKSVLYAFEEPDVQKKGRYLGEFKVTAAADKQITLAPTAKLTPREVERLATAKKPWTLYEVMPRDQHYIFADLSDAEKKALLPAEVLPEYLKDGKPAAKDDPAECVADGTYVRPLRDYRILFDADRVNYTDMVDLFEATTRDKDLVEAALAEAKLQKAAAKDAVATTTTELTKYTSEGKAVAALRKTLEDKVAAMKALVARMMENNKVMAGQIARLQWDAVRRIDQRTRAMAQSTGTGGK
jgi:hypothetical protein